ncbi:MAG: putative rane protein, partial [Verrucomicrobiaceae bacterium]|nr:putative rane protein [Verrucomicrobiaceae bacterium]
MFRLFHIALVIAIIVLGAIGISRLSYNVEILDLLPKGMPGVEGTALFQKVYDRPDQLIITVKGDSDVAADDAAEALVAALSKQPDLLRSVRHKPSWETHPEDMLELVAYSWLNAPPEKVKALQASLAPDQIDKTLKQRVAKLAGSMDPMEVAIASNDVLGLTQAMREGMDSSTMESMGSGGGFANAEGTFRVLYADAAKPMNGYRETSTWLNKIKELSTAAVKPDVQLGFTGSPAFQAEIGSGMESDMSQSVSGITFVVAFMFWLLHRRIKPLFFILLAMLGTGLITLGVAGLMFGSLNVMSMGFAAILMGMIEDFGVLGLNEAMHHPKDSFQVIHKRLFPSIWWSAITSAAVFGALGLSTLPGIAQMGVLTGLGIIIGAAVMLYGFLPIAMRLCVGEAHATSTESSSTKVRWPGYAALGLLVTCIGVLGVRGLPGVVSGAGVLRPKHCQAFESLMVFEEQMKPEKDTVEWLPVIVQGKDEPTLATALKQADAELVKAQKSGDVLSGFLPLAFAPHPANQQTNLPVLGAIAADRDRLLKAAESAGFNERGLALAKKVTEQWALWFKEDSANVRWPDLGKLDDSIGRQLHRDAKGLAAVGFVRMTKTPAIFDSPVIAALQTIPGVHVAGWDYLS